jgi:hypothetical protein
MYKTFLCILVAWRSIYRYHLTWLVMGCVFFQAHTLYCYTKSSCIKQILPIRMTQGQNQCLKNTTGGNYFLTENEQKTRTPSIYNFIFGGLDTGGLTPLQMPPPSCSWFLSFLIIFILC